MILPARPVHRVAVGCALAALLACAPSDEEPDGDVFALEVGDCFDDPEGPIEQVADVPIVGCEHPHDNEVYAIVELEDGGFPGDTAVAEQAQDGCIERFEAYVGVPYRDSELFATWLFPTEASWQEGDREVVCVLFAQDEPLEGSMRGAAR